MLGWLHRAGSFEAASHVTARPMFTRLLDTAIRAIGDFERLEEAFDGVRIRSLETARQWLGRPPRQLAYKRGETHWVNWQKPHRSIFR